jgi:hypothetical protein
MSNETWFTWVVPAVALGLGAISFFVVWLGSRDFDRRYGRHPK